MRTKNFKKQILNILIESFMKNDKNKIKNILTLFKNNKDFKDIYLLYENIENKYFDDKEVAKKYVEILSEQLSGKLDFLKTKEFKFMNEEVDENEIENELLYEHLDTLCEKDNLKNIDKKLLSKKYITDYLTKIKKEKEKDDDINVIINENLLNTVLVNNFNNYYNNVLNEEEKSELSNLLSLSNDELKINYTEIKEDVLNKINNLITESDGELKEKLQITQEEIENMKINKNNYFRLMNLKKDIIM